MELSETTYITDIKVRKYVKFTSIRVDMFTHMIAIR